MRRITKDCLEKKVEYMNKLLGYNKIDKEYTIGYRNDCTMLDEVSQTNKDCIVRSIAHGTKTEVGHTIDSICRVLA